ncbi:MAG: PQQ-binding-like beta-propeller repeat protein [Aureliella sp.]
MSLAPAANAEDSFQFRGPAGNGVYSESLPKDWNTSKNVRWAIDVPGGGWSSPVSTGDLVFVTTAVGNGGTRPKGFGEGVQSMGSFYRSKPPAEPLSFEVHCLSLTDGNQIWKKQITSRKPPFKIHPSNSYATESPVTDGTNLYAYFAAVGVVACLDMEGQQIWMRELGAYKTGSDFGTGSALAIHDDLVYVQCDNEEESFVCALQKTSGEEVWRDGRSRGTSWSSPVIWENDSRTELVTCGNGIVTSYDPASGQILWTLKGAGGAFSASPAFDRQRIYFGQSGRTSRGPLAAVNAGAKGDLTFNDVGDEALAWVQDSSAPSMCSPVAVDGLVYVLSRGVLSCHDAESGKRVYRERLKNASSVTASLWAAGGNLFALNEAGETAVIQTGNEFESTGTNSLSGLFWSTPSATDSALLIRSALEALLHRQVRSLILQLTEDVGLKLAWDNQLSSRPRPTCNRLINTSFESEFTGEQSMAAQYGPDLCSAPLKRRNANHIC